MLLRLRVRETLRALPIFGTIEALVAVGGIGPVGISCALRTDMQSRRSARMCVAAARQARCGSERERAGRHQRKNQWFRFHRKPPAESTRSTASGAGPRVLSLTRAAATGLTYRRGSVSAVRDCLSAAKCRLLASSAKLPESGRPRQHAEIAVGARWWHEGIGAVEQLKRGEDQRRTGAGENFEVVVNEARRYDPTVDATDLASANPRRNLERRKHV
jgi:hypothetical protein